jgi:hypothetical protein
MLTCKYCQEYLTFDDKHRSKKGKKIPLGQNGEPHRCEESLQAWREEHPLICRQCGETEIYFSEEVTSVNGKMIPLEAETGEIHDCPKSTYRRKGMRT